MEHVGEAKGQVDNGIWAWIYIHRQWLFAFHSMGKVEERMSMCQNPKFSEKFKFFNLHNINIIAVN